MLQTAPWQNAATLQASTCLCVALYPLKGITFSLKDGQFDIESIHMNHIKQPNHSKSEPQIATDWWLTASGFFCSCDLLTNAISIKLDGARLLLVFTGLLLFFIASWVLCISSDFWTMRLLITLTFMMLRRRLDRWCTISSMAQAESENSAEGIAGKRARVLAVLNKPSSVVALFFKTYPPWWQGVHQFNPDLVSYRVIPYTLHGFTLWWQSAKVL